MTETSSMSQSRDRKVTVSGKPRKRAAEACTFCRRRKIKCDGAQPICVNCKTFDRDCVYIPIDEETRRQQVPRRRVRRSTQTGLADDVSSASFDESSPRGEPSTPSTDVNRSVSTLVFSANGASSYHGQTSALFEESHVETNQSRPRIARMSEPWVERGLVAEAARQRQLEDVNFAAGTLDFDGVDPELGRHLLMLHWNRQHHSFLITYRPAFMRDMACQGPYFSKILLNAIYFGAAKFSPRPEVRKDPTDVRTAGWKFRERVRELLGGALDKSEITTVQALLIMTNSLFALGSERSSAWLYAGIACRMVTDLGIHVDASDILSARKLSDEDIEIRRRTCYAAFVVDKIQSLYHGRPVTLEPRDTRVPIKFLDSYEELENWTPFAYPAHSGDHRGCPAYSVSTFTYLCKLSVILSSILTSIYAENSSEKSPAELSKILQDLQDQLRKWYNSLPAHLAIEDMRTVKINPPPHVYSLLIMHEVLVVLLHRPFVADGHLYSSTRAIVENAFLACATSATKIVGLLRAYDKAFSIRRAPYLISYATYVSATIHARIAAQRGPTSNAHACIETCLAVFEENQETNWAVRRANIVIQNLLKKLGTAPRNKPWNIHDDSDNVLNQRLSHDPGVTAVSTSISESTSTGSSSQGAPVSNASRIDYDLDLDAIIQSFAPDQEVAGAYSTTHLPYNHMVSYNQLQPQIHHMPQEVPQSQFLMDLDRAIPDVTFDDLLFGFNSSALDGYSFPEWTGS